MPKPKKVTPLMKQYNAIKKKHEGALLLFRVGDFYETFGEDAIKASRILDITLTKRANGAASEIELAGFPHHALDNYLPKLVRAGERVAICDQLEDPKAAKGIVKRGVTELVTPGLSYHDQVLEQKQNNYLAALHIHQTKGKRQAERIGLAFLDISTGEFSATEGEWSYIEKLLQSYRPTELIYSKAYYGIVSGVAPDVSEDNSAQTLRLLTEDLHTYPLEDWIFSNDYADEKLTQHFGVQNLKGFGLEGQTAASIAAGAILFYLSATEHKEVGHITRLSRIDEKEFVWLDRFTIRNLELIHSPHENGIPLINILDKTVTPMGGRLLRKWVVLPLKNKERVENRLAVVDFWVKNEAEMGEIRSYLSEIGDLERLVSKVATGRISPRELGRLRQGLQNLIPIREILQRCDCDEIQALCKRIKPCSELLELLQTRLQDELPALANQGDLIREGVHEELDELRKLAFSGKDFLEKMKVREMQETGITSLKISFNKVFGYYLEVTNAHKNKVPETWIRKQTLVNAERYITPELKEYEEKILTAEEKLQTLEQQLFAAVIRDTVPFVTDLQRNAQILATLDALASFAEVAIINRYQKPELDDSKALDIKDGRHPVIETQLPPDMPYVPNDVLLDQESQQVIIITGPNMAGKSALLRQTALIVLMAQMGSFVPASAAKIGLVDKVFTRVGASDNLSQGESTFMVEMSETASIMNNLSDRSLVLMDEIGRGTSTYDGISIAWAIVEYLHRHPYKPKTLFATHYHELNELTNELDRVKNFNVSVKEIKEKIVFLRKLKAGGSEHSFGINVAQLAGMPQEIVRRSREIMAHFEESKVSDQKRKKAKDIPKRMDYQANLFQTVDPNYQRVKELFQQLDINRISPVEALLKLNELKELMK
ncbi:MAG: DNA mismatch repair protein MutS [Bacteroidota bacterium]